MKKAFSVLVILFVSFQLNAQWVQTANNPNGEYVYSFAISGTNIFAGTYSDVYLSTNNGTNWSKVNAGLTDTLVRTLVISGTNIFAGTFEAGIWRRSLSELTGISIKEKVLPQEFTLFQNFPNPFNPMTTINYSIIKEGHVKITVYNIIGSKVSVKVDENKSSGNYSVQFNAGAIPSGIYFYKLESGSYSDIKKLVMMK